MFTPTTATKKIFNLRKRIRAVAGGMSASKTISILIWLIDYAQTNDNQVITVVAESVPHLRLGAIRDFQTIMREQGYWNQNDWADKTYKFSTGSIIEFISFDKFGKAHGPRRDILFINEANNIPYNIADQLIGRTRKIIWLDWNPTSEFWFYTEMQPNRTDIDFLTLTYLDNEALDEISRQEILSHRKNKQWWRVYGEGQLGEVEGRIYTDWKIINEIPHEARLEVRGLDFGFTNDPSVLVDIYQYNGGYIVDEQFHRTGMLNKQIAQYIKNLTEPQTLVIADGAEPKSIISIRQRGVNIIGADKSPGSVKPGINFVQEQRISVTSRSLNIIKSYRNYMWKVDRITGKSINKPNHAFSDAMDAIRYGMENFNTNKDEVEDPYFNKVGTHYIDE